MSCWRAAPSSTQGHCSSLDAEPHQHPIWIKKPRFDSESTHLFVASVLGELLRAKIVYEASVSSSFLLGNAPRAVRSRIWMKQQFYEEEGETALAISPR
jgi:hypothetical protein